MPKAKAPQAEAPATAETPTTEELKVDAPQGETTPDPNTPPAPEIPPAIAPALLTVIADGAPVPGKPHQHTTAHGITVTTRW